MKVLVTGTEGYIGMRLASRLMGYGHDVMGLDSGFYREGTLYTDPISLPQLPLTRFKDLRNIGPDDLADCDAVVHLAELSNDPLGEHNPQNTYQINHQGSIRIASAAREAGVKRFVYASSCSVYGVANQDFVDETTEVNPQTVYAECKCLVEQDLKKMCTDDFSVVFLRNATAYGPSPRMRFDIVLNDLCAMAWTTKRIELISDGTPWRPIVHVEDICEAIRCALEAPAEMVNGEVYNVGSTTENYRIAEIAQIVVATFPGCELKIGEASADNRSYRVSFDKIAKKLPGFKARWQAKDGALEFRRLFERIDLTREAYGFRAFTRLRQLHYLQRTGQVDENLYWNRR